MYLKTVVDFFYDPLEDKIVYVYIIQSRSSFCASPSCPA
jgi:hypothetical protein